MSFSPSTCLSLIEKLSDQLINIKHHRLKNVTNTTINETTPTTPITRNKVSISHNKEIIRNSILNMMSSDFQRNNSLQAELVSSLKSLKEKLNVKMKDVSTSMYTHVEDAATITEDFQPTEYREQTVPDAAVMVRPPDTPRVPDAKASTSSSVDSGVTSKESIHPAPFGLPGTLSDPKKAILLGKDSSRTLFLTDSILKQIVTR